MIPKNKRKYVHAIYAFARTADDLADEALISPELTKDDGNVIPTKVGIQSNGLVLDSRFHGNDCLLSRTTVTDNKEERLHLLNKWEEKLSQCVYGNPEHPIFVALKETIARFEIPVELLKDLLTAFKMDTINKRYLKMEDVLLYCRYSANPVGRIILYLFGYKDPELHRLSDFICTALQLTNFWQDVAIDLEKDRIYIPMNDMDKFGYTENELISHVYNNAFKKLLTYEVEYTRGLFMQGQPLCSKVEGGLSLELKAVWSGGMKILEKIKHNGYDVFNRRPVITAMDKVKIVSRALTMRRLKTDIE